MQNILYLNTSIMMFNITHPFSSQKQFAMKVRVSLFIFILCCVVAQSLSKPLDLQTGGNHDSFDKRIVQYLSGKCKLLFFFKPTSHLSSHGTELLVTGSVYLCEHFLNSYNNNCCHHFFTLEHELTFLYLVTPYSFFVVLKINIHFAMDLFFL